MRGSYESFKREREREGQRERWGRGREGWRKVDSAKPLVYFESIARQCSRVLGLIRLASVIQNCLIRKVQPHRPSCAINTVRPPSSPLLSLSLFTRSTLPSINAVRDTRWWCYIYQEIWILRSILYLLCCGKQYIILLSWYLYKFSKFLLLSYFSLSLSLFAFSL